MANKHQPQAMILQHTNVAISSNDKAVTISTLNALLAEEQAAHKITEINLAEAKQLLTNQEQNTSNAIARMEAAEKELKEILCPWHTWNCKSRVACARTNKRKLEEKDQYIEELEEGLERVDAGCYNGHQHHHYHQTP